MRGKKLVIGVLAHVDAGKTTLAESMLYLSGAIRRQGRVDHGDAFLDTDSQERDRGITIFSKQALFTWRDMEVTLLDTPGHADFSAEMERTLQVLDCAVLVVSGADGVQGQVPTLWRLLGRYRVPTFLFVNKMDQPGTDKTALMAQLRDRLDGRCVDFGARDAAFYEALAVCDDALLERYLDAEAESAETLIDREAIAALVAERSVFPCYFGSALRAEGVEELLDGLCDYVRAPSYPAAFGARVFKIARDEKGCRLTYVKITGGSLRVKETVRACGRDGETEEKVDQIRLYSGSRYTVEQEATAGTVCALAGPVSTYCGEGLGAETGDTVSLLAPIMAYRILLPDGCDVHRAYQKLCQLEEEEPQLHIVWRGRTGGQDGELQAQLMGEVQIEVLKNIIGQRCGLSVDFDEGGVAYRETIAAPVEGVGHYEPLRHYAEVHLLLEPGEPGSGLVFGTRCSEDVLDRNWQRLILTHLREKEHLGVLTGSPVTDMRITLVAGRAHLKHTEGGDFRQAVYRAVRQGLCRARSILLEPVYAFRLELPAAVIGRGMTDMQNRGAKFGAPETTGDCAVLTGTVPASQMAGYQAELMSYSGGQGRLYTEFSGYEPCRNAEEVIAGIGYDAQGDIENPCGSVFCAHGAGFAVAWNEVESYMHIDSVFPGGVLAGDEAERDGDDGFYGAAGLRIGAVQDGAHGSAVDFIAQDEIDEIMNRTYGSRERKKQGWARTVRAPSPAEEGRRAGGDGEKRDRGQNREPGEEYLLVDGYNIIFAWEELSELAKTNLDGARGRLMDILSNYQGYRGMRLILVFDAYKVKGNPGSASRYHNIDVVYTKEAETADQYIEKVTHAIGRKYRVRVATSNGLEQLIIMGAGAIRVSAGELREEILAASGELRDMWRVR